MSEPITLPEWNIRCGQPTVFAIVMTNDDDTPVDLTAWVARFAISDGVGNAAIVEVLDADIEKTSDGDVSISLTDVQTSALQGFAGGCLVYQLDLVDGDDVVSFRFQGRVSAFERILP